MPHLVWLLSNALAGPDLAATELPPEAAEARPRRRHRRVDGAPAEPVPAPTPAPVPSPAPDPRPQVELVIALDVSGSMESLLDSARMKLWSVVQQVSRAEPQPEVRVGLYTYGNSEPGVDVSHLRRELALTEDLDLVSERMMGLTTSGSEEYVGWVISDATAGAGWDADDPDPIRLLFVCGNETADQARARSDFREAGEVARAAGITVNALYGGSDPKGRQDLWPEVAEAGGGIYAAIDMVAGTVRLPPAPQDGVLEELNAQLNETYVTVRGAEDSKTRQIAEDASSRSLGTSATRIATKGSGVYRAASWDLVDGWEAGRIDLSNTALLPGYLQGKSLAEREAYVIQLRTERRRVQARIREVSAEREAWMAAERAKLTALQPTDLGEAINAAVRDQLSARGLSFPPR